MDIVNELTGLIGNLGFPIACVIAMFYMQNKEREAHKEEMANMTEAINNNTAILSKLLERMSIDA